MSTLDISSDQALAMLKAFVEKLARALVDDPDEVKVLEIVGGTTVIYEISAAPGDVGKIVDHEIDFEKIDFTAAIEYASRFFSEPARMWRNASSKLKEALVGLIFEDPPAWDGKRYVNLHKDGVVMALQQHDDPSSTLVTPRGFEPLLQG